MSESRAAIACIGAGRMGRGIAVTFAFAGHRVRLIDMKPRDAGAFAALRTETSAELRATFGNLVKLGLLGETAVETLMGRIVIFCEDDAGSALLDAAVVFEGVPEIPELKRETFARISPLCAPDAVIASTTSTFLVDDIAGSVERPERFLNAHWLNPAYLIPLVEMAPGSKTDPAAIDRLKELLEGIGKKPVVCAATPGFIVPRIQVLAMNEAARMVEEGVASPEDIDRAIRYGFGLRYAVLGLLEFIDWGGGDILYYASRYLTGALGSDRYAAPAIIERNMAEGRTGMKAGEGFLDYRNIDIEAFQIEKLKAFAALLNMLGLTRPAVLD